MKITQISVFLENKKGRLYEVTSLLGENSINIRALTIAESEDFGVLRMVVDKPDDAVKILKDKGFVSTITDIIAVEVEDKPGGLSDILKVIYESKINIEYMYAFVEKRSNKALLVFRFDDIDGAIEILSKSGIRVLGKSEIASM